MQNNSVDVIIPTFNHGKYLISAIKSVLNQTVKINNIWIIDDGSTDDTKSLVKELISEDPQINYHFQSNKGLSSARNTGLKLSKSEYVAFLDADDTWSETKIAKQLEVFNKANSNLGVVYCDYEIMDHSGKVDQTHHVYKLQTNLRGNIHHDLIEANKVSSSGSGVLVRRVCFEKAGLFDECLTACEDWDMWLRISKYFAFDYVNQKLVQIRRTAQNMSNDSTLLLINKIKLYNKLVKDEDLTDKAIHRFRQEYYLNIIEHRFLVNYIHNVNQNFSKKLSGLIFTKDINLVVDILKSVHTYFVFRKNFFK